MPIMTADEIYERVRELPPAERLRLVERIAHELSEHQAEPVRRRLWSEIRGIVSYPMFGEDAQAYISRTRQEADEGREAQLRRPSS